MREDTQEKVILWGFATSKEIGLSELHCSQQNFIVALVVVGHKQFAVLQNNEVTRTWRQKQFGDKVEDTLFIRMYVYCYYMLKDYMYIFRFGSRASCSLLQASRGYFCWEKTDSQFTICPRFQVQSSMAQGLGTSQSFWQITLHRCKRIIIKLLFIHYCCSGR